MPVGTVHLTTGRIVVYIVAGIAGILSLVAKSLAPSTKKSAPLIRNTNPTNNKIIVKILIITKSYSSSL